jgi:tetratricopeptide (TPR) repeat protein
MAFFQNSIETQFCNTVNAALQSHDGGKLRSILIIEPPFDHIYQQLIDSLKKRYPNNAASSEEALESVLRNGVPETQESEDDKGHPVPAWGAMVSFLAGWMAFIRDVNVDNILDTYERLADLQQKANSALQHPTKGLVILPTVIGYAKVFSRVAIGLEKRPELIQHLITRNISEDGRRESLPEKAANILRSAFITCLNDRTADPSGIVNGKPDRKKIGIYKMANICLKILFQCEKLDNCEMIFNNIQNSSPPLRYYPASERVTYLYYLGRFQFACTNFYEAQLCLQKAYEDCKREFLGQRRLILIYLIAANILQGRFPTRTVYTRPEARGLRERFEPLTMAIRKGDLESFRRITNLDLSHEHASWFSRYQIFYQLGNYCEIYVWRSVFRKVFLLTGKQGETDRSAPTIDLNAVLAAFQYFERRLLMSPSMAQADAGPGRRHISFILSDFTAPASAGYIDPDFEGVEGIEPYVEKTDYLEIESICGSLIMQGFLNGFISHRTKRFAITGARRTGGALNAGFPNIWQVISGKHDDNVPGWRIHELTSGGNVVRLASARPAGS